MHSCHICGSSIANEWRHCPEVDNQLICGSEHCKACKHWRKEEDKGTLWCTYWHGHKDAKEERKNEIAETKKKIAELDKQQADLYRKGYWSKAEDVVWEIVELQRKIKRLENLKGA